MRLAFVFVVMASWFSPLFAQNENDSTLAKKDSVTENDSTRFIGGRKVITIESYAKRFDPRRALFFAAILPGAGQAYNKKYWKIPLVYGGFAGLIGVVKFYNDVEVKYSNQLFKALANPGAPAFPGTTSILTNYDITPKLRTIVDQARRERDYFSIITGFFYILQIVDAHVDAHLKEFDLNPQLHVRLNPIVGPSQGFGMGVQIKF